MYRNLEPIRRTAVASILVSFAGAFLSAILALAAAPQSALADPPARPVGSLKVEQSNNGEIILAWGGPVAAPMASQISSAFEQHKQRGDTVVFKISSGGGSVAEGERVIEVLREIRKTHRLQTVVEQGRFCGSMCVFIYLQGQKRVAALSSLWLFHEVSHSDPRTNEIVRLDRPAWERLVVKYFGPAGVSAEWTERMKPMTINSDYWQTGGDLVRDQSGIVHATLGNQRERLIADRGGAKPNAPEPVPAPPAARPDTAAPAPAPEPTPAPRGDPTPAKVASRASETKQCRGYEPSRQIYVNVPCAVNVDGP